MSETMTDDRPRDSLNEQFRTLRVVLPDVADRLDQIIAAVREHHNQRGDDRCHFDDLKLYRAVLGEGVDPYVGALPPDEDMEESCRRYIRQRRCPGPQGVLPLPGDMTIAQLSAEVERLQAENSNLRERLGDIEHRDKVRRSIDPSDRRA